MNSIVYISYVKTDEALAVEIASKLEAYHIPCFLGEESVVTKEKLANLDCMRILVFLFSKNSLNSNIIDNEITTAINSQVPIVPFQVDKTYIKENRSLDFMLQKSQWVLGYPDREKQMDNLIVSVCRFMGVDAIQENPTDPFEQLKRGIALEYGTNGLSCNRKEAMLWLEKSAENGNFLAMYELYKFFVNSEDGNDTHDYAKARGYLIMAADNGLAVAQYELGTCYEVYDELLVEHYVNLLPDISLPLGIRKDITKARYYYDKAARQGYKKAKDRLDYLNTLKSPTNTTDISDNGLASYDKALSLMPENPRDSFYHMADAAAAGLPIAQFRMGQILLRGIGTFPDHAMAAKWLKRADIPGLPDATMLLGEMYKTGDGVEKDMKKAKDCFKRAAIQYNTIAEYNKIANKKDRIDI
ncbi:TPR repeat [Xylanibacter ruminicola]|uniref:TPR repeat n=1 Tax=Xylanibacter ruminicola TaxID=839 RepID=A0A1M7JTK3_XYLRU|nr:toll/interleukin-1 receptor domain-containing protein [Xylanibacter ruminicola]SHM55877.1 TPR repeat [Xylanibacter ruminicola]